MVKSWLEKARTLHDIGASLDTLSYRKKHDLICEERYERRWRQLGRHLPVSEDLRRYFGSYLHDSSTIGFDRKGDSATLSLHSVYGDQFDWTLRAIQRVDHLRTGPPEHLYRIDLQFSGVHYCTTKEGYLNRDLVYGRWPGPSSLDPEKGDELLDDYFFTEDDRLQWVAHIWRREPTSSRRWNTVYLLIDCESVSVVDLQAEAAELNFGPFARTLWDDVWTGVDADVASLWVDDGLRIYLEQRADHHGIDLANGCWRTDGR